MSLKNLIKIYEPCFNNGITSTNIPLKAEYDIVWWYKCQIEIAMPTFTFYYLQKQPYKCSEIKIIRTVDLTVCYIIYDITGSTLVPDKTSNVGKEVERIRKLLATIEIEVITYGIIKNPEMSVSGMKMKTSKFGKDGSTTHPFY